MSVNHTRIELPKQLSKEKNVEPCSFYQNLRFTPNNGSSIVLGNSTQTSIIELTPQSIINFSKLKLQFTRSAVVAAPAGTIPTNCAGSNYYLLNNAFCSFINRIQIFDSKNLILLDMNNCEIVSKSLAFNKTFGNRTEVNCFNFSGIRSTLDPIPSSNPGWNPYYFPINQPVTTIDEPSNVEYSNAASNLSAKNYNLNLSDLVYDSILSLDRNIYSANSIFIKITWNPISKVSFGTIAWAGTSGSGAFAGPGGVPVTFALSNIQINMYSEANPILANIIKMNPQEETIIYAEPQLNVLTFGGSTQQSSMRIISNALPGEARLYKMYYWLAKGDATYKINNTSNLLTSTTNGVQMVCGAIAQSWRLYVNNNLILDLNISVNQDDLELVKNQYATNSFKSAGCYYENGAVSYVFGSNYSSKDEYSQMTLKGVDFNQNGEIILQNLFSINGAQDLTHYAMFVVLRCLYIQNGMFSWYPSVR